MTTGRSTSLSSRHALTLLLVLTVAHCGTGESSGRHGTSGVAAEAGGAGGYGGNGRTDAEANGTLAVGSPEVPDSGGTVGTVPRTGDAGTESAGSGDGGTGGIGSSDAGAGDAGAADASGGQVGGDAGASGGDGGAGGGTTAFDRAAVQAIMRLVADYEIARFGTNNDSGWVRSVFHTGMLAAYRALGDAKYRDYTLQWGQANNWQLFSNANGPRFADNQTCVQSYAELYLEAPTAQNSVMIAAAQTTFDAMVASPKAGRVEWHWCDALYMAPAAMARVAQATGKTQYVTLMDTMFWDTKAFLYDPAQSLFWRDSTFVNTNTYWSRGNGWVVGGIARILEVLPATDSRRSDYETLLTQMAAKLRAIQASDGFWRSSLTQPDAFTTPETSGTTFFCYGLAWGINHGILDRSTYLPTVTKAWAALGTAVSAQGRLGWVQAVGLQPGPSTVDSTNDYATGAFLLAGSEVLNL